jgi:hypothetical protein
MSRDASLLGGLRVAMFVSTGTFVSDLLAFYATLLPYYTQYLRFRHTRKSLQLLCWQV